MLKETAATKRNIKTDCKDCPLQALHTFREFSDDELAFVSTFKRGETVADTGMTIIEQGTSTPFLYTVMTGWGFRSRMLEDGRRQVLNYVMPGDFIGLQSTLMDDMQHSVESLSPMELCIFERSQFHTLLGASADLAFDITWIAAQEERMLDEHITSLGQRSALERTAYLIAYLHARAQQTQLFPEPARHLPLTQQLLADTLGLSLVHTNRTVKKLNERNHIRWTNAGCDVLNFEALCDIADWQPPEEQRRPFI